MELLATFTQKDVFPSQIDNREEVSFEDRTTGKAIVFDNEDHVALVGNRVNSFYLLPGGGIDSGESVKSGIIRECVEEIGCHVELMHPIGIIEDYRNRDKKHCISHCYTAKLVGEKGNQSLTDDERNNGMHVIWVSLEEAAKILNDETEQLEKGEVTFYNTGFNILRDHKFLEKARALLKNE